jgi:C4-dicarboxylate transporter DctQ subunit
VLRFRERAMGFVKKFEVVFDFILDLFAGLAAILIVILMVGVTAQVCMTYFLNRPVIWVIEIAQYCLVFITFLGSPWVLKHRGHVMMDLWVERLGVGMEARVRGLTSIIGMITCLIVTWYGVRVGWDYFQISFTYSDSDLIRVPAYLLVSVIPVSAFLMSIEFFRTAYQCLDRVKDSSKLRAKVGGGIPPQSEGK